MGQFSYIWAKGAIKDVGKALGIPFETTNTITKQIDDETIDEILEQNLLAEYQTQYPKLFEYVEHLAGLPKSFGAHPCGRGILQDKAVIYNAVEFNADTNEWVLQGDMHTADDLGIVKCDLLGLRTLDVIYDVLDMIGKDYDYIAPHKIDVSDQKVWQEFAKGHTDCIFQFESDGMKAMLNDMKCNCIENLSAANALYRPGSKAFISNYVNRKNGTEKIEYLHPDLEPILSKSYGIIIFQEQLIEIGRLAKLPNPDELRKATAKKKPELMAKIEPQLKQGLLDRGWTQKQCDELWKVILDFAQYSFNKCVSGSTIILPYYCDDRIYYNVAEMYEHSCAGYDEGFSLYDDGILRKNLIVDIQPSGFRPVYRVETESGKWLDCTMNHKFPTPTGIKYLYELSVGEELYSVDIVKSRLPYADAIKSITCKGREMTYDVTMADPAHNFVANNGLITCNSHSSAYALTAYISMYLKVHHPSEYITAYINSYEGEIKGIIKTIQEGRRMGLTIKFDNWRTIQSKTTCKDGVIYLGLNTIKGFGNSVADALHRISDKSKTFTEVLVNAKDEPTLSDAQIETLIAHDFFKEFGNADALSQLHNIFRNVYGRKVFAKNGKLAIDENVLRMFSKETEKQFRDVRYVELIEYLGKNIQSKKRPLAAVLRKELDDFGYINYTNPNAEKMFYITAIDIKFSPKLSVYNLKNGLHFTAKVNKKQFAKSPICVGNILTADFEVKPKMEKKGEEWVVLPNIKEFWIKNYKIIK